MRWLIGCEFTGSVRRAFRALGHDAWSCDLLPAADGSPYHIQDKAWRSAGCGSSSAWILATAGSARSDHARLVAVLGSVGHPHCHARASVQNLSRALRQKWSTHEHL